MVVGLGTRLWVSWIRGVFNQNFDWDFVGVQENWLRKWHLEYTLYINNAL